MSRQTPAGLLFLGAGLGFGLGLLRKTLLRGLHVLHFGEHDVGGVLELKGGILQLLGALRKTGLLVFHIFELLNASKFDRAAISPHGIPGLRRPGRRVRGAGPNEDDTKGREASDERYAREVRGALTRRPGRRC